MNKRKTFPMVVVMIIVGASCASGATLEQIHADVLENRAVLNRMEQRQYNINGRMNKLEAKTAAQAGAIAALVSIGAAFTTRKKGE